MQTGKFSLVFVLALLIVSCAPVAQPTPPSTPKLSESPQAASSAEAKPAAPTATTKVGADQPKYGGTLTRANYEDAPHLDVHQGTGVKETLALSSVYNGLVRYDASDVNKLVPDLAEKWDVSADSKTYVFSLRNGVKWHDGKPFTAQDVEFNLKRMAFWKDYKIVSPKSGQSLSGVETVEAIDASSVKVTLKYPSVSFLGNLASGWVMVLPTHIIEAKGDMKKDAIGTGAFKWKAWNIGVSQELVKNPDYFVKGLPYLDKMIVYIIKDDATRLAAFRTGQVRMTGIASKALTHAEAEMVRKEMGDKAVVITHAAAARYLLVMNLKRKPWDDIRVRQAVDLGFDRKAAITINSNVGMLGAAMHPKGAWGIPEEEMAKRPGYRQPKDADIAKAKSLLAEAGYPQGFKSKMLVRAGGAEERQGVVAKDQLAKIGIDVSLDVKETGTVDSNLERHDFDLCSRIFSDSADDPDPTFSGYYVTGGSRNYGEFSDTQLDDLFKKQAAMLDEKERKKVVLEMQGRILDQAVYPITFWDVYNLGFWKEVRGYTPGFGPYTHNNLDHVWLAQ